MSILLYDRQHRHFNGLKLVTLKVEKWLIDFVSEAAVLVEADMKWF